MRCRPTCTVGQGVAPFMTRTSIRECTKGVLLCTLLYYRRLIAGQVFTVPKVGLELQNNNFQILALFP